MAQVRLDCNATKLLVAGFLSLSSFALARAELSTGPPEPGGYGMVAGEKAERTLARGGSSMRNELSSHKYEDASDDKHYHKPKQRR